MKSFYLYLKKDEYELDFMRNTIKMPLLAYIFALFGRVILDNKFRIKI